LSDIKINGLVKRFDDAGGPVEVLTGVDLEIARGDAVVITGPSGAGKSTLLHLIGGLDQPTAGTIQIGGQTIHDLPERALARNRLQRGQVGPFTALFVTICGAIRDRFDGPAKPFRDGHGDHSVLSIADVARRTRIAPSGPTILSQLEGKRGQIYFTI